MSLTMCQLAPNPKGVIMRIISKFIAMAGLGLFGLSQQASAAVLYDNGPLLGLSNSIYSVYSTADSFTLSQDSVVTGVNFNVWFIPGDTFFSVDFGITNTPYTYADNGTASVTLGPGFAGSPTLPNGATEGAAASFLVGSIPLAAGTYYLVLSNAVTAFNSVIYWDLNYGPSFGYQCSNGGLANVYCGGASGSNSFQIIGQAVTPLPSTWTMMLIGFVGLWFFTYRGSKKNAATLGAA
jgi:hypothetical protein